jgi:two-component system chemotaxis response regulator CheY
MASIHNQILDDEPPLEAYRGMLNLRVLLAEPSIPQQKIIRSQFENQGIFNITIVDSGEALLTTMIQEQPDLVVSAMYLPDMTGEQLIHEIRASVQFEYVPFLLISSETDTQLLEPIRQAGVIGILPKPFELHDLRRALCAAYDLRFSTQLSESSTIDFENLEVLLVDDSVLSRNHLRRILENLGVQHIDEAENGLHATEFLEYKTYDLLLTDYIMPEMDGRELIRFVREKSDQRSIPALIITSEQNKKKLTELENCGSSAVCDKPFEPRVICDLIEQLLTD